MYDIINVDSQRKAMILTSASVETLMQVRTNDNRKDYSVNELLARDVASKEAMTTARPMMVQLLRLQRTRFC